jgi:hypothetical protein
MGNFKIPRLINGLTSLIQCAYIFSVFIYSCFTSKATNEVIGLVPETTYDEVAEAFIGRASYYIVDERS